MCASFVSCLNNEPIFEDVLTRCMKQNFTWQLLCQQIRDDNVQQQSGIIWAATHGALDHSYVSENVVPQKVGHLIHSKIIGRLNDVVYRLRTKEKKSLLISLCAVQQSVGSRNKKCVQ